MCIQCITRQRSRLNVCPSAHDHDRTKTHRTAHPHKHIPFEQHRAATVCTRRPVLGRSRIRVRVCVRVCIGQTFWVRCWPGRAVRACGPSTTAAASAASSPAASLSSMKTRFSVHHQCAALARRVAHAACRESSVLTRENIMVCLAVPCERI